MACGKVLDSVFHCHSQEGFGQRGFLPAGVRSEVVQDHEVVLAQPYGVGVDPGIGFRGCFPLLNQTLHGYPGLGTEHSTQTGLASQQLGEAYASLYRSS